jgi:trehalose 6-phosphate phosphatase
MMHPLLSDIGLQRLDAIAASRLLCAFDFDGTLAPIVSQPGLARLPEEVREQLISLSAYAPVAVITGRSIDDIRERLGFDPDFIVGNHGMEGVPGMESHAALHEQLCADWREHLGSALSAPRFDSGVYVEDKRDSLSVHYRQARDPDFVAQALQALFIKLMPRPRVVAGKYVFNLLPQDAMHKGDALEQLMLTGNAHNALYVGDDVTDEDVFRLRRRDVVSVRIESTVDSAADFFLPQQRDILQLLDALSRRLRAVGASNWLRHAAAQGA